MRAYPSIAALALAVGLCPSAASAAIFVYGGVATGSQEVPPNASPGSGSATITYDDVLHSLRVEVSFTDLLGLTIASHIHVPLIAGTNGPVATTVPTFTGFPLGVTSGTYDQTFDLTQAASFNPSFITSSGGTAASAETALALGLSDGRAYLNVHTSLFPAGEIRANLAAAAVPEPASWALMIGGFALAGGALRRRTARLMSI